MAQVIDLIMKLQDDVTSKLKGIRSEMEQTAKMNTRLGGDIARAGKGMTAIGTAMTPIAAGITAVGTLGVKTFMDFDATITGAGIKAGATAEEMEKMRSVASRLGADFPITAREAAEGMDRLAAGGFNAEQAIAAMPGIIEASVASGEDLAATSDVVTSALSIWNMTQGDVAANTTHVADVIQAAANASKLGMQDFGLAMQYAGAPAAALGVSIEELGTAMAVMSNNGIEASTIGTSLRSTMSRLASPPKAAAEAISQLGLTVKDENGNFVGLNNVIDQMRGKMAGLSDTEQVALAKAIAGEDAYSGLLALIKTSPEAYSQAADAITNSAGSSHAAYVTMQNTLKGSIDSLMGSVEALGISFGAALAPTIRTVAGHLKGIADWFTNLSPATKNIIIDIAAATVGFTGFMLVGGKLVTMAGSMIAIYGQIGRVMAGHTIRNKGLQFAVQGVMRAFRMMRVAGIAMMGPMGLVVAGIVAAGILIYRNWDRIGPFFRNLWNIVSGAFGAALNRIQPTVERLGRAWHTLTDSFQHGTGIFGVLNVLSDILAGTLGGVLYGAVVLVSSVFTGVLTAAIEGVGVVVNSVIGIFSGLIDFITGVFTGDWALAWSGVVAIFDSIFGGLAGIAESVISGIKAMINGVIGGINSISVDIPSWVPTYGGQHFGLSIPYLASGTDNWRGGPAVINERGAEIVNLPRGTQVIPHDESMRRAYQMGKSTANTITVNIGTASFRDTGDEEQEVRRIASRIMFELQTRAINLNEGAI